MITQSKGKIYVAAERGLTSLPWFTSYHTFNFGSYRHGHKTAFEQLYVLNDEVLAPNRSITLTVEADTAVILIPIIGAVSYKDSSGIESCVTAGALQVFSAAKDTTITLANPYGNEAVNFLQLWIKAPYKQQALAAPFFINLDDNINQLPTMAESNAVRIAIGKFEGRQEGRYSILQKNNALFAFVIDGQMEVQHRLLQSRDGLGLWELEEMEFEALSSTAILLIAEVPLIPVG